MLPRSQLCTELRPTPKHLLVPKTAAKEPVPTLLPPPAIGFVPPRSDTPQLACAGGRLCRVNLNSTSLTPIEPASFRDFNQIHRMDVPKMPPHHPLILQVPLQGFGVQHLVDHDVGITPAALQLPLPAGRCLGHLPGGGRENSLSGPYHPTCIPCHVSSIPQL